MYFKYKTFLRFGPKTTLTDEDIPLVPLNIANQLPTVPPTQPSVSSLNTNVTPPTPMPRNLNPSIPSRTSKPASLTSQSTVNTTNVVCTFWFILLSSVLV